MARERGSDTNVAAAQRMPSNMESPLNAQKDSAEDGPPAPTGLFNTMAPDPLGICPGHEKGSK